jgi:hypothetical protein
MNAPETDLADTAQAVKRGMNAVNSHGASSGMMDAPFDTRLQRLLVDLMHAARAESPRRFNSVLAFAEHEFLKEWAVSEGLGFFLTSDKTRHP